jgi:hypothetical protein
VPSATISYSMSFEFSDDFSFSQSPVVCVCVCVCVWCVGSQVGVRAICDNFLFNEF